jgi:fructoselysine-6-P-deglycase FrlB-like protein
MSEEPRPPELDTPGKAPEFASAGLAGLNADGPEEMGVEIAAGPVAVEAALIQVERDLAALRDASREARRVVLVGTGASLAVARTAAAVWPSSRSRLHGTRSVIVRESSAAILGPTDGLEFGHEDLTIVLTQSGASPETLSAARRARRLGAAVLAITAHPGSAIGEAAHRVLHIPSGEEHGASTKSELATLAALLAIAGALDPREPERTALRAGLEAALNDWAALPALGSELAAAERVWMVGFGSALGIAQAGALLWHEKVRRAALGTTPSEFRHGLVEAARPGDAVLLVDADAALPARTAYLSLLDAEIGRLDVRSVRILPVAMLDRAGEGTFDLPLRLAHDRGAPLEALLRVQQLARAAAHAAGTYRDGFAILRTIVKAAPTVE